MKKMRRLIPAIAMLLVSAVMLSTATFAWFTMNENVTASGMQIQARATGSLVISTSPLTYIDANPSVDFNDASAHQLTPIHLTEAGVWKKPNNLSAVNPITGNPGIEGMGNYTADPSGCYFDYTIYLGTSGEAALEDAEVTVVLDAPVAAVGEATKAYAVAVYVVGVVTKDNAENLGGAAWNATPVAIVHVDRTLEPVIGADGQPEKDDQGNAKTIARNTATFKLEDYDIPSVVGVGDQNEKVTGLKVVLRLYVDGALDSNTATKPVNTGYYTYTQVAANATYPASNVPKYYVATGAANDPASYTRVTDEEIDKAVNGWVPTGWYTMSTGTDGEGKTTYTFTEVSQFVVDAEGQPTDVRATVTDGGEYYVRNYKEANTQDYVAGDDIPDDWFTRAAESVDSKYMYVNNKEVPTTGSTLSVQFSAQIPGEEDAGN